MCFSKRSLRFSTWDSLLERSTNKTLESMSSLSMGSRLLSIECDDPMGAVPGAVSAVDADHRFVVLFIPEYGLDDAHFLAIATADAFS
jgi:hypothetical protein